MVEVGLGAKLGDHARCVDFHVGGHLDVPRSRFVGLRTVEGLEARARAVHGPRQLDRGPEHLEATPEKAQVAAPRPDPQRPARVQRRSGRLARTRIALQLERHDRIRTAAHPDVVADLDGHVEVDGVARAGALRSSCAHAHAEPLLEIETVASAQLHGLDVRRLAFLGVERGPVHRDLAAHAWCAQVSRHLEPAVQLRLGLGRVHGHEASEPRIQIHVALSPPEQGGRPRRVEGASRFDACAFQPDRLPRKGERGLALLELDAQEGQAHPAFAERQVPRERGPLRDASHGHGSVEPTL